MNTSNTDEWCPECGQPAHDFACLTSSTDEESLRGQLDAALQDIGITPMMPVPTSEELRRKIIDAVLPIVAIHKPKAKETK